MATFLVSIPYVTYADYSCEKAGLPFISGADEVLPELISIYIDADSELAALEWAAHIGDRYSQIIEDVPDWKDRDLHPYIERNPEESDLIGLDSFLQKVRAGEEPRYEGMTKEAYLEWLEDNWRET